MNVRPRVLIVHNDYQMYGGETAAVEAEARLLESRGHEVIRYSRHNDELSTFSAMEKAAAVPGAIYSRRTYRDVRTLVAAERPDVAHVHNVFPLISPSVYHALHDAAVPIVQTAHNFRFLCPNGLFYTHGATCERCRSGNTLHAVRLRCYRDSAGLSGVYAASLALHRAAGTFQLIDRLITPAAFAATKIAEAGVIDRDRVHVLDYFIPGALPPAAPETVPQPYFVFLGRLSEEKGIQTLIAAMRLAPAARLKVFGVGPLEATVRAAIAHQNISNVELCGFVSGERKWDVLRGALATIVPSHCYEMSPLSVIESFAAGTPVIASRLGNFPLTVGNDERGLLFDAGCPEQLAGKMEWMLAHDDCARAMGRNARAFAEARYGEDEHYRQLLAVYRQATA